MTGGSGGTACRAAIVKLCERLARRSAATDQRTRQNVNACCAVPNIGVGEARVMANGAQMLVHYARRAVELPSEFHRSRVISSIQRHATELGRALS